MSSCPTNNFLQTVCSCHLTSVLNGTQESETRWTTCQRMMHCLTVVCIICFFILLKFMLKRKKNQQLLQRMMQHFINNNNNSTVNISSLANHKLIKGSKINESFKIEPYHLSLLFISGHLVLPNEPSLSYSVLLLCNCQVIFLLSAPTLSEWETMSLIEIHVSGWIFN